MALFYQKGTISDMSEVQSGTSQSGREWQRMDLILETPGFQGAVYKMVFRVSGDKVKDVSLYNRGDKVQVGFTIYAREWNGKFYNNIDLVTITDETGAVKTAYEETKPKAQTQINKQDSLNPAENPDDLPF